MCILMWSIVVNKVHRLNSTTNGKFWSFVTSTKFTVSYRQQFCSPVENSNIFPATFPRCHTFFWNVAGTWKGNTKSHNHNMLCLFIAGFSCSWNVIEWLFSLMVFEGKQIVHKQQKTTTHSIPSFFFLDSMFSFTSNREIYPRNRRITQQSNIVVKCLFSFLKFVRFCLSFENFSKLFSFFLINGWFVENCQLQFSSTILKNMLWLNLIWE